MFTSHTQTKKTTLGVLSLFFLLAIVLISSPVNAQEIYVSGLNYLAIYDVENDILIKNITIDSNQNDYNNQYLSLNNNTDIIYVGGTRVHAYNSSDLSYIGITPVTSGNPSHIFYDGLSNHVYLTTSYAGNKLKKYNPLTLDEVLTASYTNKNNNFVFLDKYMYIDNGGIQPALYMYNKTLSLISNTTENKASYGLQTFNDNLYIKYDNIIHIFNKTLVSLGVTSNNNIHLSHNFLIDDYVYAISTSNTLLKLHKLNLSLYEQSSVFSGTLNGLKEFDNNYLYVILGNNVSLIDKEDFSIYKNINFSVPIRDITMYTNVVNSPPNPAENIKPSNVTITLNSTGVNIPINWTGGDDNNSNVVTTQIYLDFMGTYTFIANTTTQNSSMTLDNNLVTSSFYNLWLNLTDGKNHTISIGENFRLCVNDWNEYNTTCESNLQTLLYEDLNTCPESYDVPANNNTINACDVGSGSGVEVNLNIDYLFILLLLITSFLIIASFKSGSLTIFFVSIAFISLLTIFFYASYEESLILIGGALSVFSLFVMQLKNYV